MFTTTRWSLVLAGANSEGDQQKAAQALAELCRTYWRPIFSYVCRRGYSSEDAQDLTQDFFLMILETNWLRQADQGRGRFRSLLLKSLQNFLHNVADKKQTLKRGGTVQFVSWDAWMAEAPSQLSISARGLDAFAPERLFDLRWAATVVDQALRRLREECEGKGRLRLFEGLRDHLTAEHADISYAVFCLKKKTTQPATRRELLYISRASCGRESCSAGQSPKAIEVKTTSPTLNNRAD